MSLLQSMIYVLLNNNGSMGIDEIANNLKIPIEKLSHVYNSLLVTKLINKEIVNGNNTMKLSVNTSWSHTEKSLSIVHLVDKVKEMLEEKKKEQERMKVSNITVFIINALNTENPTSVDELVEQSDYDKNELLNCLDLLIKSKTIITIVDNETISYKLNMIDSDLDSD